MNPIENNTRYLAVHPTTFGLGFAVFEGPLRLIDWGTYRAQSGDKNRTCLRRLDALVKRYEPRVVLFEERGPRDRQRSKRIRHFILDATIYVRNRRILLKRIPRRRIRELFEAQGAQTKQGIAECIVDWFPELSEDLPPRRKAWMPEQPRMGMFEALALALTYFGSSDITSKNSRLRGPI
jgi:hypothetical protein